MARRSVVLVTGANGEMGHGLIHRLAEHDGYDPMTEYGFQPGELSAEEQHALAGVGPEPDDGDAEAPIPHEDVW